MYHQRPMHNVASPQSLVFPTTLASASNESVQLRIPSTTAVDDAVGKLYSSVALTTNNKVGCGIPIRTPDFESSNTLRLMYELNASIGCIEDVPVSISAGVFEATVAGTTDAAGFLSARFYPLLSFPREGGNGSIRFSMEEAGLLASIDAAYVGFVVSNRSGSTQTALYQGHVSCRVMESMPLYINPNGSN